ncbi:MAG: response regulator transcription factor [Gemmatimonadota bacterium]|nr:MAG: response regulator transcription factor [Gemmatimonadota bacterium]
MPEATVFVVDDDDALRKSLRRLMQSVGLPVETYPDAQAFQASYDPSRPGCLILDIRMPGMNGLELQQKLVSESIRIPVIIMSAHGDVEKAVRAMKAGAVDFIKKPYKGKVLLERVRHALKLDAQIRREEAQRADIAARIASLTPREHEVMKLLAAGKSPKQIAFEFGLSRKTVDVHRGHIMLKMQVDSLVELAQLVQRQEAD